MAAAKLNRSDMVEKLSEKSEVSRSGVKAVLKALEELGHETIQDGVIFSIPGLVDISVKYREARIGRNPSSGESIDVKAKYVPRVSLSKPLKDAAEVINN